MGSVRSTSQRHQGGADALVSLVGSGGSYATATMRAQAVVVSHDTLCDNDFKAALADFDCTTLLIADEVHNLGRDSFVADPPEFFDYRLGLSATPVRQYDKAGTEHCLRSLARSSSSSP